MKLPNRKQRLVNACALVAGLVIVITMVSSPASGQGNTAGAEVYKAKCATCHGQDGSGNTPVEKACR